MTELMRRRRALMGAGSGPSSRLPSAYQEVEWVAANDAQTNQCGIDTGFVPKSQNAKIITDFNPRWKGSRSVLGFATTGAPTWELYFINADKGLYYKFGSTAQVQITFSYTADTWYHVELDSHFYVDGVNCGTVAEYDMSNNAQSLYLFRSLSATKSNASLKAVEIYDGSTLVKHFIPCYRKSDGRIGFYDIVNDVFVYNTGGTTSNLLKGADVT